MSEEQGALVQEEMPVAQEEVKEEVVEEPKEEVTEEQVEPQNEEEQTHKKTAQERINEITRLRREAEREAEYWKSMALKNEQPKEIKKSVSDGRPSSEHFESVEEYEDALLEWHDKKRSAAMGIAEQQKRQKELLSSFNEKAENLRKVHADFDDVIETPVFTDTMRSVIFNSDIAPELAYKLGTDIKMARRIASLPPELQPYEIGKLETQITLSKTSKKVTAAPEPIKPVGNVSTSEVDPSKLSINEWMEWNKQHEIERIKNKYHIK